MNLKRPSQESNTDFFRQSTAPIKQSIKSQFLSSEIGQIAEREDSNSSSSSESSKTELSSPAVIGIDPAQESSSEYTASFSSHNSAKRKAREIEQDKRIAYTLQL